MVLHSPLATLDRGAHRLYQSSVVSIGATRCPPRHSECERLGPIRRHVFVFPRTPVWVDRAGEEPFLADSNRVLFHAEGDEIRRRPVDGRGATGIWFAIGYALILPRLEESSRGLERRAPGPFHVRSGPCSSAAFLEQALLVRELFERRAEPLRVDETALWLMGEVLDAAYGRPHDAHGVRGATLRRHMRLVEEIKAWFGVHYRSSATLPEIAAAVGASPFHLARIFRTHTGLSLHGYRTQLRLRYAAEAILAGAENLAELALALGFASHSHLTDAFRAAYGFPPSALRSAR
jgi:AraC-like DNA-binding protein